MPVILKVKELLYKLWRLPLVIREFVYNCFFKEEYCIIKQPNQVFPLLYSIKPDSWEKLYVSDVYKISKKYTVDCFSGAQYILSVKSARVRSNSDLVVTNQGVLWDKFFKSSFGKTIPLDNNLISFNSDKVFIAKPQEIINITGNVIYMGGVHSKVWAHFLIMYLPRLYYAAEFGLLNNNVTILLPRYGDDHIKQIIHDYLDDYQNVKIVEMNDKYDYLCDTLFYIPSFSNATDHSTYCMAIDFLIPQNVIDVLNKHLVRKYVDESKGDNRNKKIYLARRGYYRCAENWLEIESYFRDKGFDVIEPHRLSLEEKISVFYNASIIVGPYSSAFTNLLFSKDAKVLIISPLMRSTETYYYTIAHNNKLNILNVTGIDKEMNIHTNYRVSIEKIEEAYYELLNEKD